jgi:hypothetical protein
MNKKAAYQEKWEAELRILNAKINELEAKADKVRAEAKLEYAKGLEAVKAKQKDVKKKILEIKKVGSEAGEDLKAGIESALYDLKKAVNSAVSRFK